MDKKRGDIGETLWLILGAVFFAFSTYYVFDCWIHLSWYM
jgi:hypothetical protein